MKYILSLLLVLGSAALSYGQDEAKMPRPITKSGSAAMLFEIVGLDAFGLNGPGIHAGNGSILGAGMKYYLSDGLALRGLLGFGTSSSGDADVKKDTAGKNSSTLIGIAVGIEMHTHDVYSTSPYFGGQISFATGSSTNTVTSGTTSTESKFSGSTFGIGVFAGFDWYFTNGIAVGGEYMLSFSSTSSSSTIAGKTTDDPSSTSISIGTGGANLHLVVHM